MGSSFDPIFHSDPKEYEIHLDGKSGLKMIGAVIGRLFILLVAIVTSSAKPSDLAEELTPFFEKHCLECHDDLSSKGGLDLLTALNDGLKGTDAVHRWTRIFDRVRDGEMPPEKNPRPDEAEKNEFIERLRPDLIKADEAIREVVLRRLNRVEYELTIRDLLGIEIDLGHLLPEDQSAGGFDNNGEALAISAELFERYPETAQRALDEAIRFGPPPETTTFTASSLHEVGPYLDKQYKLIDGRVTTYLTDRTQYSKISTRERRLPERGLYRFRFSAAAENSEKPIAFSVVASDFRSAGAIYKNLGYFEVGKEARDFEIETVLDKGFAIQFFALGLPFYVKDPTQGSHPGIGWSEVEITGPIHEVWPPASHTALLGGVDPDKATLSDAKVILRRLMPRAWRRPVDDGEISRPLALVESALAEGRTFDESLRLGLKAVLCSPNFLFIRERGLGDRVSDHELAARLSYFLWSSMPDEDLLAADLSDPKKLASQVERLLDNPKSRRFVEHFTGQWLGLRRIDETTPDTKLYPEFDELLQFSMVRESQSFFAKLLDENLTLTNFIDSDFAMLNGRLAEHYQIPDVAGLETQSVKLPGDSVRGGILTQAAVLKVTANGTNSSPVMRGVWVLENVLGKHLPPPPPNIAGIEPDIREATTIREQLELHRNAESCDGCHRHIDPPGFALESFDPVGAYREHYLRFAVHPDNPEWGSVVKAKPVDASGVLPTGEAFTSIREFKDLLLADSDRFAFSLTERLATYALGREMGFSDREALSKIVEKTKAEGNGFRSLLTNLVLSPLFAKP